MGLDAADDCWRERFADENDFHFGKLGKKGGFDVPFFSSFFPELMPNAAPKKKKNRMICQGIPSPSMLNLIFYLKRCLKIECGKRGGSGVLGF